MSRRSQWVRCLPLLLALASLGCQIHHTPPIVEDRRVAVVDVGGFVGQPGSVEIPPEGLTLHQAIIRAKGVSLVSLGTDRTGLIRLDKLLVRMQRGREVWSFPLTLVQNDLAGLIQLTPGDLVQVAQFQDTSLGLEADDYRNSADVVAINGEHPFDGVSSIVQLQQWIRRLEVPTAKEPLGVRDLTKLDILPSQARPVSANIVVLTRANPRNGLLVEHFVLPADLYGLSFNEYSPIANPRLLPNDNYTFTSLPQLPIIQAGVVAPVVKRLIDAGVPPEECHRQIRRILAENR